jgi:hypothetical protein
MANQISSANASLPLYEVLESEFVALHGDLPTDYPSSIEPETRLKAIWQAIHNLKEKRAALCISGGWHSERDLWAWHSARLGTLRSSRQVSLSLNRRWRRIHRQLAERVDQESSAGDWWGGS